VSDRATLPPAPLSSPAPMLHLLALGVLVSVLAACSDPVGSVPSPPGEATPESLLFLSTRAGTTGPFGPLADIFRVSVDGTGLENLTQNPSRYLHLSLSPDGERVAFARADGCGIWVMGIDGSGLTELTDAPGHAPGCNAWPRWSPDGSRLAFASNRDGRQIGQTSGLYDVFVMDADGGDPRNVSEPLGEAMGFNVTVIGWSPDGDVVFQTDGATGGGVDMRVYLVRPDGTDPRPMFDRAGDHTPAWSPDGTRVAFIRQEDETRQLHLMNADGSGVTPVTDHDWDRLPREVGGFSDTVSDLDPWSPDGSRLIFERYDGGGWGTLYVVNADGTGVRRLELGHEQTMFNGWSTDGSRISYTRYQVAPESQDVYLAKVDGAPEVENLTDTPHLDSDGVWIRPR
jgi:Tol biopolymer transport system component